MASSGRRQAEQRRQEKSRRSKRDSASRTQRLSAVEQLESRAMLAIFAYDRPGGDTLIAIDGNAALTDLYMRGVGGGLQLATNAEFSARTTVDPLDWSNPSGLNPNFYTVGGSRPLYITSATPNSMDIPLSEASGFAVASTARTTDFVLSNGNIQTFTAGGFTGEIAYNGNIWTFTNDAVGRLAFTLRTGTGAGPRPVDAQSFVTRGEVTGGFGNRGAGVRGGMTVVWSAPVSTYFATAPVLSTVSYLYFSDGSSPWTEFDVGVSAGGTISFANAAAAVPKDGFGGTTLRDAAGGIVRVGGTTVFTGTITVYDVSPSGIPGAATQDLSFGFSNASGAFVFTPQQNDWLAIAPGSTPNALRFVNRYEVAGGVARAGSVTVSPGRVTLVGRETWFEYTAEATPSDVTVWPGLDVSNAITVEMTRSGGSFNALSPIVSAPSLTLRGTSNVNLEAPISVNGGITLGQGLVDGSSFPNVNTAVFDAASAAAAYNFLVVGGSLTVSPSGSLSGALPTATGGLTTAAGVVNGRMVDADFSVQGEIFATTQFYDLNNLGYTQPNVFSTRSQATGLDSGLVRGGLVVINLAASGAAPGVPDATNADTSYHVVDLRTKIDTLRTRAAGAAPLFPGDSMYPYVLSIRESDAITFDAVAGSSRPISLSADGSITMGSALDTLSDLTIAAVSTTGAATSFTVSAPIQTRFGAIDISADTVDVRNSVQVTNAAVDATRNDITLTASNGDILARNLVAAVNNVNLVQRKTGTGGQVVADGLRARSVTFDAAGRRHAWHDGGNALWPQRRGVLDP